MDVECMDICVNSHKSGDAELAAYDELALTLALSFALGCTAAAIRCSLRMVILSMVANDT